MTIDNICEHISRQVVGETNRRYLVCAHADPAVPQCGDTTPMGMVAPNLPTERIGGVLHIYRAPDRVRQYLR